jgi:hypothetical protein
MRRDPEVHQTEPVSNAASRSAALDVALLSLATVVAVLSFAKNFSHELNPGGDPYFFFTYSDGFIKRGLVGHVFNTIYPGASPEATRAAALRSFTTASMLIVALLVVWFRQVAREWIALFALFAASQFLPTLGYDTGYLDVYVYVLAIVASMAFVREGLLIVAIVGFVGPFVHETFVFMWLPLVILAVWRGGLRPVHVLALSAPILGALIVYFGHSQAAAVAQVNAAPLSDVVKDSFIKYQFGFPLTTLAQLTWHSKILPHAVNYIIALMFYTLPAALIGICYASRFKDRIALLLAAYAPALNTLIGWDLSRFLVVTSLSAVIGVLFMQSTRPAIPTRNLLWCWPVTALLFALPLIWAFYDSAFIFDPARFDFNATPWANVIRSQVIPWYNRNFVP